MSYAAEIGIVGAGPAGARAAERLAGLGADVVCWDPRAPWEKPCGGGLTAAAVRDVPGLDEVLPLSRELDRARIEIEDANVEVELNRPVYILSRHELARWQLRRAEATGARFEHVAVREIRSDSAGGWRVKLADGREPRVRRLVGADGAASRVRALLRPDLPVGLEPTRVAYLTHQEGRPAPLLVRFFPGTEGYAWVFPRPDHFSVGMVAVGPGWRRETLDREVDRFAGTLEGAAIGEPHRAGAVIGSALHPAIREPRQLGDADLAIVGDAAGLADPASGEGIRNALRSADLLAEAYEGSGTFAYYGEFVARRLEPEFRRARFERRLVYQHGLGERLIRGARHSPALYAVLLALLDAANEHRSAWLHSWLRGYRQRRTRTTTARANG